MKKLWCWKKAPLWWKIKRTKEILYFLFQQISSYCYRSLQFDYSSILDAWINYKQKWTENVRASFLRKKPVVISVFLQCVFLFLFFNFPGHIFIAFCSHLICLSPFPIPAICYPTKRNVINFMIIHQFIKCILLLSWLSYLGLMVVVHTSIGMTLSWDGQHFAEVTADSLWKGRLCGLCGDYNGNPDDEFR